MSETFRPWDEVFGPDTSPENPTVPTPIPSPVEIPEPTPVVVPPTVVPTPVNPSPAPPTVQKSSSWQTLAAAVIVGIGMIGAGYFISTKSTPTPAPTPNVPSGPVVDASLSKLLPDDQSRGMVASYFRDVSKFLETTKTIKTSGQAIESVKSASGDLQRAIGASGWATINTPISNRLIQAMGSTPANGMPDLPLDTPHLNGLTPRQILVKEYAQIGIDARGG